MYSGVFPQKHNMWFLWKYAPQTSPFKSIPDSKIIQYLDTLPTRYFIGKMVRIFQNYSSYGGLAIMKRSSLRNWRYFDLAESTFWDADQYLGSIPTIFEMLRANDIPYETVGFLDGKQNGGALSHIKNYTPKHSKNKWIYLFIGDVDHLSHMFTQESEETITKLKEIDREVERIYNDLNKLHDQVDLICFSDHGHMKVQDQFDIYELFNEHKKNLDDFIHIIDTNFARFWFRNAQEEQIVRKILKSIPSGFELEDEHFKKYNTVMPDNRYGDLIYYLDHPYMFKKTVWGYGLRTKSIHGFLPDYKEKDGVLITNVPTKTAEYVNLTDFAPSLLKNLDVKNNYEFDGSPIWE